MTVNAGSAHIPVATIQYGTNRIVSTITTKSIMEAGEPMRIIRNDWKLILVFLVATVLVGLPFDWLVQVNETLALIYLLVSMLGATHVGILFNKHVHGEKGDG